MTEAFTDADRAPTEEPIAELLRRGLAAQRRGDYVTAMVDLDAAAQARPRSTEVAETRFSTLRDVSLAHALIDRFMAELGWSSARHRGFDRLEPSLSRERVRRELTQAVAAVSEDSPPGLTMRVRLATDRFCRDGAASWSVTDLPGGLSSSDRMSFFSGLAARRRGERDEAAELFSLALARNPVGAAAALELGRIYYRRGESDRARASMTVALTHPHDCWLDVVVSLPEPVPLCKYKEYEIVLYRSEFYAVPDSGRFFFSAALGTSGLCENRVAPRLRAAMQRALPPALVAGFRRLVYATALRHRVLRPVNLTRFAHANDLRRLIDTLERGSPEPAAAAST